MKTQIALGLAAMALTLVAAKSFTTVSAYQGDPAVKGPNYSEERHQINLKAFEKNDYQSWLNNMKGRGVTRFVNKDNFGEFAKAQIAAQKGDLTLLSAFRAKYGMGAGGNGQGKGMGLHRN